MPLRTTFFLLSLFAAEHQILLGSFPAEGAGNADVVPLPRAHAHNDYEHPRPLLDALGHGYGSVEADVHLVDGELLVAHDPDEVVPGRTLEALYLNPLRERIGQGGGQVYPESKLSLILLIDIKTDGEATYRALRDVLRGYDEILTAFTLTSVERGAVTAIISGNRPRALMEAEELRYAAYDGRLGDLASPAPASPAFMPLVSSNWSAITAWQGEGALPDSAQTRLAETVAAAHAQGKILRFWATADRPEVWDVLWEAGVDLLGADDLSGLQTFLLARGAAPAPRKGFFDGEGF